MHEFLNSIPTTAKNVQTTQKENPNHILPLLLLLDSNSSLSLSSGKRLIS